MFIHLFQPPGAASFDACVHQPRAFPPSTSRASFRVNDTGEEGEASRNRNTVEKGGWTRTKVLDGRGDSPWNANSFRDNGHWAGGTSFANSRGAASRPRLSLSLSLSYQPYPHGRKGGKDRRVRSTSLFLQSLRRFRE